MRKRIFLFVVLFINLQIILTEGNLSLCSSSISAQMHEVELNNVDVVAEAPLECSYCGQKYLRENEDAHIEACPEYPVTCEKCGAGGYTRSTIKNHTCPSPTPPDGGGGGGGGGVTPTPTPGPGGGGGGGGGGSIVKPNKNKNILKRGTQYLVKWIKGKSNCLLQAKKHLNLYNKDEKYEKNRVFLVQYDENGYHQMKYLSEKGKSAWDEIKRHIDAGRAIIVGVDEHNGSPNGDKFTDHFVAIIGYSGTFPSNATLIYAENAVSDEAGQFSDDNVLIWNGKSFSGDCSHNRNHDTYVVTQYRPNF